MGATYGASKSFDACPQMPANIVVAGVGSRDGYPTCKHVLGTGIHTVALGSQKKIEVRATYKANKRLGIGLQMALGSQREGDVSLNIFMISVLNSFSGNVCLWKPLLEN